MFWDLRVAVLMVGSVRQGPLPPLPTMRRWMGSVHDAVQIWICVGCSSRLMARVGPDKCSMPLGCVAV